MNKNRHIIALIRHHFEKDDKAFLEEARLIAKEFERLGKEQLYLFISAVIGDASSWEITD